MLRLVKYIASVELGYLGDTFGREFAEPLPWYGTMDEDPSADFWVSEGESLHRVLVHVIAEINRHAGRADIVRGLNDGAIGLRADASKEGTEPIRYRFSRSRR